MKAIFSENKQQLDDLCKKLKVERLYAFGSSLTENFTSESDVDFLFSFSSDLSLEEYFENYFQFREALEKMLGRSVDLTAEYTLSNPYLIETIDRTKALLYEG